MGLGVRLEPSSLPSSLPYLQTPNSGGQRILRAGGAAWLAGKEAEDTFIYSTLSSENGKVQKKFLCGAHGNGGTAGAISPASSRRAGPAPVPDPWKRALRLPQARPLCPSHQVKSEKGYHI
jgi:hypothetical protein